MFLYKRNNRFYIGYRENGKRKGKALHRFLNLPMPVTDRQTAKNLLTTIQARAIRRELGIPVKEDSMTVGDFYLEYSRFCDKNKSLSTVRSDSYRLKGWIGFLKKIGITHIGQISKSTLNQFIKSRGASKNATVNRYVALVRASLRWGVDSGYLDGNALSGFRRLKENRNYQLSEISAEDKEKLFSIPDKRFGLFLQFIYYTLARKNEILSLAWEDVDLKRGMVTIKRTKTRIPRVIPMSDKLLTEVTNFNGNRTGRIFPWQTEYVTRKFQRLRDRLHLKIQGLHKFRHARASELLRKGANLRDVQEALGHKTPDTTLRIYAFSTTDGMRKSLNL